jgi:hypothetical protein
VIFDGVLLCLVAASPCAECDLLTCCARCSVCVSLKNLPFLSMHMCLLLVPSPAHPLCLSTSVNLPCSMMRLRFNVPRDCQCLCRRPRGFLRRNPDIEYARISKKTEQKPPNHPCRLVAFNDAIKASNVALKGSNDGMKREKEVWAAERERLLEDLRGLETR